MGVRLTVAGIGLMLLATAGCGEGVTAGESFPEAAGAEETEQPAGTTELPELSGQKVCDLLSKKTLDKYLPKAQTSNSTQRSTETQKQALCTATALDGGASARFLTIEVSAYLPTQPDGTAVEGATAEKGITEWMKSARAGEEGPEDLEGVGDEAFTVFSQSADDGRTEADAAFRSGIWGVKLNHHGLDRPNPDDRDNKVYLPKDKLISALTEMSTEIDGNLPTLTEGAGKPAKPGELTGDWLCTLLSDALIDTYLPKPETYAHTVPPNENGAGANCEWRSAKPRSDSEGLHMRTAKVNVTVFSLKAEETFADKKESAKEEHEEGPDPDGANKGSTSSAPRDVPDLGLGAYLVFGYSSADSQYPTTGATVCILLPGNRIVEVYYGGGDSAGLDTGTGGNLGVAQAITEEQAEAGAMATVKELIPQLG